MADSPVSYRTAKLKLSPPDLVGPENFEEWERSIKLRLRRDGLRGFIDGTYPVPPMLNFKAEKEYQQKRLDAYYIVRFTLDTPAIDAMKRNGFDDEADDLDPKVLWDAIIKVACPKLPIKDVHALIQELARLDYKDYGSLQAYVDRFKVLNCKLRTQGIETPDVLLQSFLLEGLKSYNADWVTSVHLQLQEGTLNYKTMVALVTQKAHEQVADGTVTGPVKKRCL